MKKLLEEYYQQNGDQSLDLHKSHEVKIREYPMMILSTESRQNQRPSITRPTTQESYSPSRRNSVNLKYYKASRKTSQQFDSSFYDTSFKSTFYGRERQNTIVNTSGSETFNRVRYI